MSPDQVFVKGDAAGQPEFGAAARGRILIVSKPAIRTGIYAAALALQGYFTRSVGNAEAASQELTASRFDCVLADGHEPRADAVVRQIRFRCGPTPAVMLLRSFADGPLAPWRIDGDTVALPEAAPLKSVVDAVSTLLDGTNGWLAAPGREPLPQHRWREMREERETTFEF